MNILRRMFHPDSGLSIIPIIAITLAVYLLLTGCASTQPIPVRTETLIFPGCDKRGHAAIVSVYHGFPPVDCPRRAAQLGHPGTALLWAVAGTMGCTFQTVPDADRVRYGEIWVLPSEWQIDHEREHFMDKDHPGRAGGDDYRTISTELVEQCAPPALAASREE